MKRLEFFFDFGSPAAYLAWTQVGRVAADAGADLIMRPMLLGGVFKATGNASPVMVAAKGKWMMGDLQLWAKRYGAAFTLPPGFPLNTLYLMRGAVALEGAPEFATYVKAVFEAMFARGENMADPAVIGQMLTEAGLDAQAIIASTQDDAVKERLKANTEEAVARGAFGAPTYFVGDQMFFGQDRLEFVAEALAG